MLANPFKALSEVFDGIAVIAGDMNGDLAEFESRIRDFREEIKKHTDNVALTCLSAAQTAECAEVFERAYEYAADFLNEYRAGLKKLVASVNTPDIFRDSFSEIILTLSSLPTNWKVDESSVNLSPAETGIHFAEYVYDANTRELKANLDEELSHYSVEGIVKNYIPTIIMYYENAFKILDSIATYALNAIERRIETLYKGLAVLRDPAEGDLLDVNMHFSMATNIIHEEVNSIRQVYQVSANMSKNINMIDTAFTHYINAKNRILTL